MAPFLHIFGSAAASAQSLGKLIGRSSAIDGTSSAGKWLESIRGEVTFEDVSFSYPSRPNTEVLRDASFKFPAQRLTAVVGVSGSGKSTLGVLMSRLYDPTRGRITLDGHDLRDMSIRQLRGCIGVINQDTSLLNRSVLENIALGLMSSNDSRVEKALLTSSLPDLTEAVRKGQPFEAVLKAQTPLIRSVVERIFKAAADADADLFVKNLEHGYATVVGSRGTELSGGQKQRLSLARAIVKDPVILLMDEATSALDSATEQNILRALTTVRNNMTTIVVAHRLATVKDAEKIIVMADGEIIEQGSHTNLVGAGGTYARLIDTQSVQVSTLMTSNISDDSTETLAAPISQDKAAFSEMEVVRGKPASYVDPEKPRIGEGKEDEKKKMFLTIRVLSRLSRPQLLIVIIGLFAAIIAGGSYTSEAVIFGHVVGRLEPCQGSSSIRATGSLFGGLFFLLGVIEFTANMMTGSVFGRVAEKLVYKVRILAFRSLFHQDLLWHISEGRSPASLLSLFTSDTHALSSLSGTITGSIMTILVNLVVSIMLTHILAWKIAVVLLATLPILLGAGFMRLRVLAQFQDRHQTIYANSIGITIEAVESIKTVAINALENDFLQVYCRSLIGPYKASFREIAYSNFWLATAYSVANLIYALAYWWGANQIAVGNYTQTQFFIVLPALLFSAQSCGQVFAMAPDVSNARLAAVRLVDLLHIGPRESGDIDTSIADPLREKSTEKDVEVGDAYQDSHPGSASDKGLSVILKDVYFNYPMRSQINVLQGLNINVLPGEFCALVGPSGAGKSTVISLIERFYRPDTGKVELDGRNIVYSDTASFRNEISLLQQESVLFDDTIRFNIALGSRPGYEASDSEIEEACREANIHSFIDSLPDGYDTRCGASVDQFSGGQKQRLCMARALVRHPRLLLLDEPTSSLDATSETIFQETLNKLRGKMTIIAIAHRLHTIQRADRIFLIEQGRCIGSGTHAEMVQRSALYRSNALHQALGT